VKQQEEAKAKEDLFLQKQLELEATVKMQKDLITQLMNQQPKPYKHTYFLYFFFDFCILFFFLKTLYSLFIYIYIYIYI